MLAITAQRYQWQLTADYKKIRNFHTVTNSNHSIVEEILMLRCNLIWTAHEGGE